MRLFPRFTKGKFCSLRGREFDCSVEVETSESGIQFYYLPENQKDLLNPLAELFSIFFAGQTGHYCFLHGYDSDEFREASVQLPVIAVEI